MLDSVLAIFWLIVSFCFRLFQVFLLILLASVVFHCFGGCGRGVMFRLSRFFDALTSCRLISE